MSLNPEFELILLALLLYLQDAVLLLRPDEAILSRGWRGRWQLSLSTDSARFGAKRLWVPNLLAVWQPLFRGTWRSSDTWDMPGADWVPLAARYGPLEPLVACIALVLFVAFPAALLGQAPVLVKLVLLATMYGYILLALAWLCWRRRQLGLSGRRLAGLAVECLVCPPIAVNLLRRLSLAVVVRQDFLNAAQQLLTAERWQDAREAFARQLDDRLALEDPGTAGHAAMAALRRRLAEDAPAGPALMTGGG